MSLTDVRDPIFNPTFLDVQKLADVDISTNPYTFNFWTAEYEYINLTKGLLKIIT